MQVLCLNATLNAELSSKTTELIRIQAELERLRQPVLRKEHEARPSSAPHVGVAAGASAPPAPGKSLRSAYPAPGKITMNGGREQLSSLPRRTSDEDEYVTADESPSISEEGEDRTQGAEANAPSAVANRRTISWFNDGPASEQSLIKGSTTPTTPTVSEVLLEVEQAILRARTISMASNPRSPRFVPRSPRFVPGQWTASSNTTAATTLLLQPLTTTSVRVVDN